MTKPQVPYPAQPPDKASEKPQCDNTQRRNRRELAAGGPLFAKLDFRNKRRSDEPSVAEESAAFGNSFDQLLLPRPTATDNSASGLGPTCLSVDVVRDDMALRAPAHRDVQVLTLSDRLFLKRGRRAGCPIRENDALPDLPPSKVHLVHFAREFRCGVSSFFLHAAVEFHDHRLFCVISRRYERGWMTLCRQFARRYRRQAPVNLLLWDPMKMVKSKEVVAFLLSLPEAFDLRVRGKTRRPPMFHMEELTPKSRFFTASLPLRAAVENTVKRRLEGLRQQKLKTAPSGTPVEITNADLAVIEQDLHLIGREYLAVYLREEDRWHPRRR